jgi:hypothetical protein
MRGNEQIHGRCSHRRRHAPMRERLADRARDVRIGNELAERKRCDGTPDAPLKLGSAKREWQIEAPQLPGEIGAHLHSRFGKQSVGRLALGTPFPRHERAADDCPVVAYDHQIATNRCRNT